MVLSTLVGLQWLGPVFLLLVVTVEVVLYVMLSRSAGSRLERRRESLIRTLQTRAA